MSDTVYSDGSIQITDKELRLPHRKYQLRGVKSVSIDSAGIETTKLWRWRFLYLYALFFIGRRLLEEPDSLRFRISLREDTPVIDLGLIFFLIPIAIAVRAYILYRSRSDKGKRIYTATISGSFSKAIAAASLHRDQVEEVVDAITRAVSGASTSTTPIPDEENNSLDVIRYRNEVDGQKRLRISLDRKVYDAQDIRTAEKVSAWTYSQGTLVGLVVDVSVLLILVALMGSRLIPEGGFPGTVIAFVPLLGSELLINLAIWLRGCREVYLVRLVTASGTDYAFASIDGERVQRVLDALAFVLPYGSGSGYISDSAVEVNDTMARFGKRRFPIEDIQEVDVQVLRLKKQKQGVTGTAVFMLGGGLAAAGAFLGAAESGYWLLGLGSLLLLPGVILLMASKQVTYTLTLQGSFGDVEAYSSHSELYVRKIATVLRRVMMENSETMEAQKT